MSLPSSPSYFFFLVITLSLSLFILVSSQLNLCRTSCGNIPIHYPFSIDDGCGNPYYRHILYCSPGQQLLLRTPSGTYPIRHVDYSDPHILISDPYMWNCLDGDHFRKTRPFSLDTSTHFSLSSQNDYLFFNCSKDSVIIEPKPIFCERYPEKCDSSCDSSSHLCRNLPECASALAGGSCCSYKPRVSESLRLMLKYCTSYTSIYWRNIGISPPYDQVAEYGIRVDFDIPVTTRCLQCEDTSKGGGKCGFDTQTRDFLCLCEDRNVTTYCKDPKFPRHSKKIAVVAGTLTTVSVAGAVGVGAGIFYLKKMREKAPVTHGVQSNDNRLF